MPRLVVTGQVKDVEAWLRFKAKVQANPSTSAVASDGGSYVAMDGSNFVATTWNIPDMDAFLAAMAAPAPVLAEAAEDGAMIPPIRMFIEK